jgi:predicted TPR repeat methyltransferase
MVAATDDLDWFLRSGELGARSLVDTLANRAPALGEFKTILDFGCGCARVLRHVKGMTPAALHGSDCNARAIEWCKENLKFATFTVNALEPPLTYPDGMFDLIYVFSILTHLTEPLQQQWMAELRRVLAPGGYLALSLHGEKAAEALSADDHARFKSGAMVVREAEVVGTNYCSSYHPESYVRKVLARGFEIIDLVPEGAKGCPPQDLYLMRRSDQA